MIAVIRVEAHCHIDLRIALRERKRRTARRQIEADLCKRTDAMGAEICDDRLALIVEGRIAEMCMGVKNFTCFLHKNLMGSDPPYENLTFM